MEFELSQEHQQLRDTIRDFIRREVPREDVRAADRDHRFPRELWQRLLDAHLMDWPLPVDAGGLGGDMLGTTIISEELSYGAFPLGVIYLTEAFSAVNSLARYGSPDQRRLLGELAAGRSFFAFSFTEPGGGQDVLGAMATRARVTPDGFALNGAKIFTTMASSADHLIVLARTSDGAKRHHGLSMLVVPVSTPGVTIRELSTIAYWSTATCEVAFDDVHLGPDAVLGEVDRGWEQIVHSLDMEKVLIAAAGVGLGQAALDDATSYARQRHAFGRPIGAFQAIQHNLARSSAEIDAARLLTYKAAWLADRGGRFTVEATRAKWMATEACQAATDRGMRTLAGYGVTADFDMQRYFRDARVLMFGPITNEMALNIIGEHGLGLPRSY